MSFLPENYQAPKAAGNYMKFQEGDNKFRILSKPILGWEDWQDNKPVRFKLNDKPLKPIDPARPVRHFWAMIVWNYNEERVQILHVTQASIRNSIEALCKDEDWGLPYFYDMKVIKKGKGKDTEYTLNPLPHKPLPAHAKEAFNSKPCWLDALYTNQDPFQVYDDLTAGIFTTEDVPSPKKVEKIEIPKIEIVNAKQALELIEIIGDCDVIYQNTVSSFLKKNKIESLYHLPADLYEKIKKKALLERALFIAEKQEDIIDKALAQENDKHE